MAKREKLGVIHASQYDFWSQQRRYAEEGREAMREKERNEQK